MNIEIYNKNTEWFKLVYNRLIEKAKTRGLKKKHLDYYTEKHHIIPKCMGGKDKKDNYVLLTFREHVIAHELLARIYDDNIDLKHVVYFMYYGSGKKNKHKVRLTTRQLEELRTASIKFLSNKFKGGVIKKDWIEKAKITKIRNGGLSKEAKKAMALGRVGMIFTESRKKKISESLKGKTITEETRLKLSISHGKRIQGPDGTIYNSISECSEKTGITQRKLSYWIKHNPEKGYKALTFTNKIKVIDPEGEIHPSINKCAEKYNRTGKCIKNWIENYPEKGFKYYVI